jgi:DNA-binding PucR family transcriptional regulator
MLSGSEPNELPALQATVGVLQAQNAALRQLVVIHDRLGALILQGADVSAITRMMADLVGRRILLLDALLQVVAMAVPSGDDRFSVDGFVWAPGQDYVRAVLATLARERRPLRVPPMADFGVDASCVLAPVAVGEAILGYLAILAEGEAAGGEDLDLQIVQHAATVYALSMMRERTASEVARQVEDELFEGLLLGRNQDEQVARERAMRLGYNPEVSYRVLVLTASESDGAHAERPEQRRRLLETLAEDRPERTAQRQRLLETLAEDRPESTAQRRRLLETLAELCVRRSVEVFAGMRSDEMVALVPEAVGARELGRAALQQAAALLPAWQVTVGIGGPCGSAGAIARSYAQARRALATAQRFGNQGDVVAFEDLGVYRLLFHVTDPAELSGFIDQVLGPLIDYDQRHHADFVHTLARFLAHNGNLQATARELNLHVNSVTYRMQRIQAIAGLDLEQSEDRLLAQVALKIFNGVN